MINGMIKAHPMNNRMARQAAHRYAAPLPLLQLAGSGDRRNWAGGSQRWATTSRRRLAADSGRPSWS
jgi:hypothetical protein